MVSLPNSYNVAGLKNRHDQIEDFLIQINKLRPRPFSYIFSKLGTIYTQRIQFLEEQLDFTNKFLLEIRGHQSELVGTDLTKELEIIDEFIPLLIKLNDVYNSGSGKLLFVFHQANLKEINKINLQILDNLYSIMRLLKKCNKKNSVETSDMARSAAKMSAHAINTIYARH